MNNLFTDKNTGNFSAINFIVIITVAIHAIVLLMPSLGACLTDYGGLSPKKVLFGAQVWRIITYAFLHDPQLLFHIAFNMLGLYMFGKEIEYMWGNRRFFEFYILSALFAGVFSLLAIFISSPYINIIGASGALMALLVVYAYYFPERQLLFLFVIPMKVKTAVVIYAVISVFGTTGNVGNVSHITHLGGLIAGFLWIHIGDRFDLLIRNITAFFQNAFTRKSMENYKFPKPQPNSKAERINKILDKINRCGIQSLTAAERKFLQESSADSL
jgi:membrane associated rhomboid family serine protease